MIASREDRRKELRVTMTKLIQENKLSQNNPKLPRSFPTNERFSEIWWELVNRSISRKGGLSLEVKEHSIYEASIGGSLLLQSPFLVSLEFLWTESSYQRDRPS